MLQNFSISQGFSLCQIEWCERGSEPRSEGIPWNRPQPLCFFSYFFFWSCAFHTLLICSSSHPQAMHPSTVNTSRLDISIPEPCLPSISACDCHTSYTTDSQIFSATTFFFPEVILHVGVPFFFSGMAFLQPFPKIKKTGTECHVSLISLLRAPQNFSLIRLCSALSSECTISQQTRASEGCSFPTAKPARHLSHLNMLRASSRADFMLLLLFFFCFFFFSSSVST